MLRSLLQAALLPQIPRVLASLLQAPLLRSELLRARLLRAELLRVGLRFVLQLVLRR